MTVCISNADVLAEEKSRQVESLTVSILPYIALSSKFMRVPLHTAPINHLLKVHWYDECKDKNTQTNTHTHME